MTGRSECDVVHVGEMAEVPVIRRNLFPPTSRQWDNKLKIQ